VNKDDAAELSRRYRLTKPARIVPIGVDLSQFPKRERDPGGQVIGFFGNISWGANLDAATWFVERILPRIWQKVPSAQFRMIGPGSENVVPGNQDARIVRSGPSHIPDAMNDATIGVVPVISGTGVRLKLFEMLSMGVPVVTTSLGGLGTGCVDGEHASIADAPDSFAAAAVALLGDAKRRREFTLAGWELVQRHSWQSFYPRILSVLEEAVAARRSGMMAAGTAAEQEAS
jgi:polysaccharide biosynthesis protein PslH